MLCTDSDYTSLGRTARLGLVAIGGPGPPPLFHFSSIFFGIARIHLLRTDEGHG